MRCDVSLFPPGAKRIRPAERRKNPQTNAADHLAQDPAKNRREPQATDCCLLHSVSPVRNLAGPGHSMLAGTGPLTDRQPTRQQLDGSPKSLAEGWFEPRIGWQTGKSTKKIWPVSHSRTPPFIGVSEDGQSN